MQTKRLTKSQKPLKENFMQKQPNLVKKRKNLKKNIELRLKVEEMSLVKKRKRKLNLKRNCLK
jgi:hypothetical protein